jgi:hypothetical protein
MNLQGRKWCLSHTRIKKYIQVILPYQLWQPSLLVRYILSNIFNIKVRREGKQNTLNSIQTFIWSIESWERSCKRYTKWPKMICWLCNDPWEWKSEPNKRQKTQLPNTNNLVAGYFTCHQIHATLSHLISDTSLSLLFLLFLNKKVSLSLSL